MAAINTLDGSTLGDNLITSHQVGYMSSALIPAAQDVENNQEHLVANTVGSITLLVIVTLFVQETIVMSE